MCYVWQHIFLNYLKKIISEINNLSLVDKSTIIPSTTFSFSYFDYELDIDIYYNTNG